MATKPSDETRFTLLSPESVHLFAETIGVVGLPNALTKSLAEDATFRIRHIIQTASQYMKHAKRRRLTTEDLNRALQICSIEPIFGYGSSEEMPFRSTTVKDTEIFFVEEKDVSVRELALGTVVPTDPGETTVKAQWLCLEGINQTLNQGAALGGKKTTPNETPQQQKTLSEACLKYYKHITKAILESDEKCRKVSLEDLRTNPKISSLLAYFVNFISTGVKLYSHDLKQLSHILAMVRSIVDNPSLFLEPYVIQLVTAVMYCLLESLAISLNPANDHWRLRNDAARILAHISRKCNNAVNYLRHQLLMTLQEVLVDDGRPYCSHYGAVVGLAELGPEGLEHFLLPYIKNYWKLLQQVLQDNSPSNAVLQGEAYKVYGALMQASGSFLKSKTKGVPANSYNFQVNNSSHPMLRANLSPWSGASMLERRPSQRSRSTSSNSSHSNSPYQRLYSIFGDSLIPAIAFNNWQDSSVTKNNLLRIQPLTHAYFPLRPLRRDSTVVRELINSARAHLNSQRNRDLTGSLLHPGRKRLRSEDETTRHPDTKREKKSKWSSLSLGPATKLSTHIHYVFESSSRGVASATLVPHRKGGKISIPKQESERIPEMAPTQNHVVTGRIKRRFRSTRPVITNGNRYDYHLGVTL